MNRRVRMGGVMVLWGVLIVAAGCQPALNVRPQGIGISDGEPAWIRDGEPIIFENEEWYPADGIEGLLDAEVAQVADYRGVQVFIDKLDVRPYNRLYTKFGRNKFRYFETREQK